MVLPVIFSRDTEVGPWPIICIVIGAPWKHPSQCDMLVNIHPSNRRHQKPPARLPLRVLFLSFLADLLFFFF